MKKETILIIGAGEFGRALEFVFKQGGFEVAIWDKDQNKISGEKSLEILLETARAVFLAVPALAVSEVLEEIKVFAGRGAIFVTLSKGLAYDGRTMFEVCRDILGSSFNFCHASGPMLAEELIEGLPAFILIASQNQETGLKIKSIFDKTSIKTGLTEDFQGLCWGSVLKNIYALGLGMSDGLKLGFNIKGYLGALAIYEMKEILIFFGAGQEIIDSPIIMADFLTTSVGKLSSNYSAGYEIGQRGKTESVPEGLKALPILAEKLGEKINEYPLLLTIKKIILNQEDPTILKSFINN